MCTGIDAWAGSNRGGTQARHVRARVPHVCYWCSDAILAGESYSRWAVFGDTPRITVIRVHLPKCPKGDGPEIDF